MNTTERATSSTILSAQRSEQGQGPHHRSDHSDPSWVLSECCNARPGLSHALLFSAYGSAPWQLPSQGKDLLPWASFPRSPNWTETLLTPAHPAVQWTSRYDFLHLQHVPVLWLLGMVTLSFSLPHPCLAHSRYKLRQYRG